MLVREIHIDDVAYSIERIERVDIRDYGHDTHDITIQYDKRDIDHPSIPLQTIADLVSILAKNRIPFRYYFQ